MDPITFAVWIWLTWGVGRMFLRDHPHSTPAPAGPPEQEPARGADDAQARLTLRERAAERVRRFVDAADTVADEARRTDWGNAGWWLRALLAAAWMPLRDVRYGARWAKAKVDDRRRRPDDTSGDAETDTPDLDDEAAQPDDDQPSGREQGDSEGRGRREERRRQQTSQPRDPDEGDLEYEVEVIGTTPNTPRPGQLPPPIRQLEAADDATPDQPEQSDTTEGEQMAGQYVAIPGATSPATRGGFSPATTTGNGDTHGDAKEFARQIVQAMERTADPVDQAAEMLRVCVLAAWEKVDRLQAAGVGGVVLEEWGDAVILFEAAKQTSRALVQQVTEARDAAAKARSRQVAVGDRIEDVVTAAGKSAANHTSYYGKQ